MPSNKIIIARGEDRLLPLKAFFSESRDPFDLTDVTKISVFFRKADGTDLERNTELQGGAFATNTHETIVFTADIIGSGGNSIVLAFDGIKDITTVLSDWNTANPTNLASSAVGTDESQVLGTTNLTLAGGVNQVALVSITDPVLSKYSVQLSDADTNSLRIGEEQSFKVFLDKGTHPGGERRIIYYRNVLDIVDNVI